MATCLYNLDMEEKNKTIIGIIVLAAGSSSRMGKSKQLIDIHGETLLSKSVHTALESKSKNIVVVLGAREAEHRAVIKNFPVSIQYNPHWEKGMGSSLKAGLHFLMSGEPGLDAVMVMVCDQPLLTSAHLNALIDRYQATRMPVIASSYAGAMGVPALFDRSQFTELNSLDDRHGAKKIIDSGKEFTDSIDFPGGSIDLDTPDDVKRFLQ